MATRDLREKYGKIAGKSRAAINAAIRAELPAGNQVLDLLELAHQAGHRKGWQDADGKPSLLSAIHDRLVDAANEMEAEIRSRYDMPPLPGR